MLKKFLKRRGQVLVFYALLMPLLILFVGVGMDLGWYFVNVSRLQNAADAAAIAGAKKIVDDTENFQGIDRSVLVSLTANRPFESNMKYTPIGTEQTTLANAKVIAKTYVNKNLSGNDSAEDITNTWTKNSINDEEIFYDYGTAFYYVVSLNENIRHLFLPGWFDDMAAPVVAAVKLAQMDLTDVRNKNTIIGNWEVQNYYREQTIVYEKDAKGKYMSDPSGKYKYLPVYAKNEDGSYKLDVNGEKIPVYVNNRASEFESRFGYEFYEGAWNHFQDFYNHYKPGDFHRTETVTIRDDVTTDSTGTIISYGANSSVAATAAAINNDPYSTAYNPEHKDTLKTYKAGITEKGTVGLPYTSDRLDSINIDFRPEVGFDKNKASGRWLSEDWDLWMDNTDVAFNNRKWNKTGNVITDDQIKRMRIHTSINFEEPYKERAESYRDRDSSNNLLPDILWCRIESEPMLYHPDVTAEGQTARKSITGLNSVQQIIINVNQSNCGNDDRPVIIFYDGPERYSTANSIRDSKPVILNLNAPFQGVLYVPNSPVVIIGSAMNSFKGFIVAKSYLRLKDDDDFEPGGYRYFKNANKQYEYSRELDTDGTGVYRDSNGNLQNKKDINDGNVYKVAYYYAKNENSDTKYYKITDENGIDMYIDDCGNIKYAELRAGDALQSHICGQYETFGRTDFTTHNYQINATSAINLLLS